LAVEWKKVRTEEQGSAEDVITAAKEAPATKMFASETQAEEKALLAKDTDSKPRKDSWSGLDMPHREMQDLLANGYPFFSRPIAHTRGKWPAEDDITAAKEAPATKMVASEAQAEEKVLLTKDTDSKPRKNSWLDRWDIQDRKIRELLANDDPFSDRALGGDKWISAEASVARPAHRLVADLPCVGAGYQDGGEPGGDEDLGCQTNADLGVSVYGSKDENEEDEEDEEDGGEEDEEYKEEEEDDEPPVYEFDRAGVRSNCGSEIIRESCSCCNGVCDRGCIHDEYVYVSDVYDTSHPKTSHLSAFDRFFGAGGVCGGVFSPPERSSTPAFNSLFTCVDRLSDAVFQYKHEGPDKEGNVPLFRIEGRALRSTQYGVRSTEPDPDPTVTYSNKAYNVPANDVVILSSPYKGRVWVRADDRITVNLRQVCGGKDEEETIRIRTDQPLYRVGVCNGSATKYQMDPNLEGYLSCSVAASSRDLEIIITDAPRILTQEKLANEEARCAPLAHGWHLFVSSTFDGEPETTMLPVRLIHHLK
jgi:hypothetical protein